MKHISLLIVLLVAAFLTAGPAMGQSAYFSLEGDFTINADKHDFLFDLTRSVGSGEDLRFRTYHFSGGTNAAGDTIALGSFDSILELVRQPQPFAASGRDRPRNPL